MLSMMIIGMPIMVAVVGGITADMTGADAEPGCASER